MFGVSERIRETEFRYLLERERAREREFTYLFEPLSFCDVETQLQR